MKSKLIKGLVLAGFIILLSGVLLFRGGYLKQHSTRDSIKSPPTANLDAKLDAKRAEDSFISAFIDSMPLVQLPSSKAVIVVPRTFLSRSDSERLRKTYWRMMSGSKSGPVFDPTTFKVDSILMEIKREQAEKKNQE